MATALGAGKWLSRDVAVDQPAAVGWNRIDSDINGHVEQNKRFYEIYGPAAILPPVFAFFYKYLANVCCGYLPSTRSTGRRDR